MLRSILRCPPAKLLFAVMLLSLLAILPHGNSASPVLYFQARHAALVNDHPAGCNDEDLAAGTGCCGNFQCTGQSVAVLSGVGLVRVIMAVVPKPLRHQVYPTSDWVDNAFEPPRPTA